MGNIFGVGTEKRNTSSTPENKNRLDYERNILSLGTENCVDYSESSTLFVALCGCRIPGELVAEILCKLPVKSLIRFKAVCKPWNLLINSPVFINKHLHRKHPQIGGYSVQFQGDFIPAEINFVVGTCNGILCLYVFPKSKMVLFNPSTRDYSFLQFRPRACSAFCYLPETQEYQIVIFSRDRDNRNVDVKTVTLGKITSFRDDKNISLPGHIKDLMNATCGTTLFWLGHEHDNPENTIVICYDVIQRRFSKMNIPPSPSLGFVGRSLRMFKGSVIMFVTPPRESTFEIWMLIDDISNGKSWMKYRKGGPLETDVVIPIDCWYDRWILCSNKTLRGDEQSDCFFYYDLQTDQIEDYCDFHNIQKHKTSYMGGLVNYVESLVSIKSLVPYIDRDG